MGCAGSSFLTAGRTEALQVAFPQLPITSEQYTVSKQKLGRVN